MSIIDLEATARRAIELMTEKGLSSERIRSYSKLGFSVIISHFSDKGERSVTPEMLDRYILEKKNNVKNGDMPYTLWRTLYRSAGMLKLCAKNDSVDLPHGTRWDFIKNYTRENIWERPPSEVNLNDPEDIFSLVWRTGKALETSGMTVDDVNRYKSKGLKVILKFHTDLETETYSAQLVEDKVSDIRKKYESGLTAADSFQKLRRAAKWVQEIHDTGKITLEPLPRWGLREPIEPFKTLLDEYVNDEKESGILCESSIKEYKYRIRAFLFELEDNGYDSVECFKRTVINNSLNDFMKRYSDDFPNVIKPLKKFLRFLFVKRYTAVDLSLSLPEFASRKKTFHEGFSTEEIKKLLEQPDRTTSLGKRDYAIMILAAQTGLRGCDIVGLKFENIDWRSREIRLVQRKTGKPIILPLEPESGNAVADYILNGRPESDLPDLFLGHRGRHEPLKSHTGVIIVSRYVKKAGIVPNHRSIHAFRRTYGTGLLQNDVPLEMIQQLLGHSDMNSTKPYLSIDEQGLKKCALPLLSVTKGGNKE